MKALTIQLYKDKKERIQAMCQRHLIVQKPKVESNKKIYKREKYRGNNGEI
jgi:hypothetical protein